MFVCLFVVFLTPVFRPLGAPGGPLVWAVHFKYSSRNAPPNKKQHWNISMPKEAALE